MIKILLIGAGIALAIYSCLVAASDDDDEHGRG